MPKETTEVLEEAMDVVEDTIDILEDRTAWLLNNHKSHLVLTALVCTALGLTVGHLVSVKRLKNKYQQLANEEIADVKASYTVPRVMPDADKPSLEELAARAENEREISEVKEISETNGYVAYNKVDTVAQAVPASTVLVEKNIFESLEPDRYFNMEEELERREARPEDPYVITENEFNEAELEYDQVSVTYYDGDDVLADDKDAVVETDVTVGDENLLRFGHGCTDQNIVHVRNERLEVDFEVVRSTGKYAKEVLGFDDVLSHSDRRNIRRMRPERD